jgi:hypothetical protein
MVIKIIKKERRFLGEMQRACIVIRCMERKIVKW